MPLFRRSLKLRRMSLGEIRFRAAEFLQTGRERRMYRALKVKKYDRLFPEGEADSLLEKCRQLVPGTWPEEMKKFSCEHAVEYNLARSHALEESRTILEGNYELLGESFDLGEHIDWHRDPQSGYRWKRQFYRDLPLYDINEQVDVKYVWELGRQQYVVQLSRGWLFSKDSRYAETAAALVTDWIDQNPVYEGIHWTSALEVAMRSISWIWALATLATWDGWHHEDLESIAGSLQDHATYLQNHLSLYSSPYNHLMGEATALYLIGCVLSENRQAKFCQRRGREILSRHGARQFYSDGFCVEQATGYHFFTLGFLTLAILAARQQSQPLETLESVVHRAFRTGKLIQRPDGLWPAIGDVDSARSIPVAAENFWDFGSLCNLAAEMFDDPQLKTTDSGPGEELYWLRGATGIENWRALSEEETLPCCAVLEESGYVVARQSWGKSSPWLLFDSGPIAHGLCTDSTPSTAHGHLDALQVLFSLGETPLLTDSGIPTYNGSRECIDYFRSVAAHNTVEVDGVSMAKTSGRLAWSHVCDRTAIEANLSDEAWVAVGRVELNPNVIIERHLLLTPHHGLWIADWIKNDRPRAVRWYWQVPNEVEETCWGQDTLDWKLGSHRTRLSFQLSPVEFRSDLIRSSQSSSAGWRARNYGELKAGTRLSFESEPSSHILAVTRIGGTPVRFKVTVHNEQISGTFGQGLPNENEWDFGSSAEQENVIEWQIADESGKYHCVAGSNECVRNSQQQRVDGVGNLTVSHSFAVTTVTSE